MSIGFAPHAIHDIDVAAEHLEAGRSGGGNRFQTDLLQTLERLEKLPESAPLYDPPSPLFPGLRVAQLKKFYHYAVYYQPTPDGIRVERVLHTSRNVAAIFDPPAPPDSC